MDPCEAYEDWEDWDGDERFEALKELIQEALEEWGFDSVDVVNTDLDGEPPEYDSGIIYLDTNDDARFGDAQDAMSHAYHEAMHAILDQAGLGGGGLEEELEAGFLGSRAADEALQGCECGEPAESSGGGDAPPFPWRCDLDSGF